MSDVRSDRDDTNIGGRSDAYCPEMTEVLAMECGRYELPQALREKLRAFEGKLKRLETIFTICGTGIGFLFAWFLLYLSDRLWDTPAAVRLVLAVGCMIACAWFVNFWLRRWIYRRRDLRDLAKLIQKEHRELGDRLLGIVELADDEHPDEISPSLVRAAIRQVARESEGLDFKQAAKSRRPRSYAFTFTLSLIVFGGLLTFNPAAGMNSLLRLINPVGEVDRYTFVSLEDLPDVWIVAHGEKFPFKVGIKKDSFMRPQEAKAWIGQLREPLESMIENGYAVFTMPEQNEESTLRVKIGDARREILVKPVRRPSIKDIRVFVSYPDYLKKSSPVQTVDGLTFEILKGSSVTLDADLHDKDAPREIKTVVASINGNDASGRVELTEAGFRIPNLRINSVLNVEMTWIDAYGLEGHKPHKLKLIPKDDQSPVVTLPRLGRTSRFYEILMDEAMTIDMEGLDDHGLHSLDVEWYVSDRDGNRLTASTLKQIIVPGDPDKAFLRGKFVFAPEMMGIPPRTVVSLYGATSDYFPNRPRSRSPEYKFNILSHEEHAKGIQDRFDRIQTALEDLIREQEALKDRADAIKKLTEEQLKDPKTAERIKALERDQEAQRRAMEALAKQGAELLKEAMKNKKISGAHLQEWNKMIQNMKAISGSNMKQAQKNLGKAGQNQKQRREEMKKAAEQMAEAMKKMQKLLKEFNKAMEELAARNFVQRLKALAESEKGIGGAMQQVLADTIGLTADELPGEAHAKLNKIAVNSLDVRNRSNELLDDLDGFFTRTRLKKYEMVVKDMQKVEMLDKLDKQTKLIRDNRGMMLLQAASYWQGKFKEWAKILGDDDSSKSQSGKGQGQMTPEQLELLLKLLRIVQQEYGLRNKTRELDKNRDIDESYPEKSKRLGEVQNRIHSDLKAVIEKVPPQSKKKLEMAGDAMLDAERFLKVPDTGKQTIAAINHVIELLTQGCKSCSQSMGCKPSMLALLMQQLGMGQGMGAGAGAGGGSTAGGGIDDGKTDPGGKTSNDELDERTEKKTAGQSLEQVPPEFREALKAYYNAIQELEE